MEAADKNLSENASLQVITEIKIAGGTRVVVREDDGKIDADIWKVSPGYGRVSTGQPHRDD